MISEAKLSALLVAALVGVGLTMTFGAAFRDVGAALAIAVPVALILGLVMALFATDEIRKGGDKPPQKEPTKGK
jgi:predicted histidine transporter YuiF (NhaC family)